MQALIHISLRNLLRQKRRNLLLGAAIALGTMVLLLSTSFARGISDTLFEKVVATFTGHVTINFIRDGYQGASEFNNRDKILNIINNKVQYSSFYESITGYARVIGNGKANNSFLTGVDLESKIPLSFRVIEGNISALRRTDCENPVLIAVKQAEALNVSVGDILNARYTDNHGQKQTARLTVAGTCISTSFMSDMQIMMETGALKEMLGYGPHDIGPLYIMIQNPKKRASQVADSLHPLFMPGLAVIETSVTGKSDNSAKTAILGMKTDSASVALLTKELKTSGEPENTDFWKNGVMISRELAEALQLTTGDTCSISWKAEFENHPVVMPLVITATYESENLIDNAGILVNENLFYSMFYEHWPVKHQFSMMPDSSCPVRSALADEWILLPRNRSTAQMSERYWELFQNPSKAVAIDVMSMYEGGSVVTSIEGVLTMLSFCGIIILFVIIQIGVLNTLRLTIQERTGEIGTMRAIGMQKRDIRNVFFMEVIFLALFSALSGAALSYFTMLILQFLSFSVDSPFGILLTDGHLPFSPSFAAGVGYILFVVLLALTTSWFPVCKAARIAPADALRHVKN